MLYSGTTHCYCVTAARALAFHQDMNNQNPAGVDQTDEEAAAAPIIPEEKRPLSMILCISDPGCSGEDENCTTIVLETREVDELTGEYRMVKIRLKPGQAVIFWSDLLHRGGRNSTLVNRFTAFAMFAKLDGPTWSSEYPSIFPGLNPELVWLCNDLEVIPYRTLHAMHTRVICRNSRWMTLTKWSDQSPQNYRVMQWSNHIDTTFPPNRCLL